MHCTCIACITIDSVMRMEKKRIVHKFIQENANKEKKISEFINAGLDLDYSSDSE